MSEPFIAQINAWGNAFTVQFWAECAGQLLAIGQNPALYSLLGTAYGGDGRVAMGIPNLRHRAPMGAGFGPGLMDRVEGDLPGHDLVSLNSNQLPAHNHGKPVGTSVELSEEAAPSDQAVPGVRKVGTDIKKVYTVGTGHAPGDVKHMSDHTISMEGGNLPHQNMQPYLGIYFQIALTGIYPPRN